MNETLDTAIPEARLRLLAEAMTIGAALHGAPLSIDSTGIRWPSGWRLGYVASPATGGWYLTVLSRNRENLYAPTEHAC